uniref:Uncharacterized protein n=1 Tax=Lactuca sativa TaxID=4236 RepID=A0A9R1UFU1_LACSA|nr:hypothetical protein LSAT_V11C900479720 [Lactuca sativa]
MGNKEGIAKSQSLHHAYFVSNINNKIGILDGSKITYSINKEGIAKSQYLHPAYFVSNINNKIRILDGSKITYSIWVKLFKLHATSYKFYSGSITLGRMKSWYKSWKTTPLQRQHGTSAIPLMIIAKNLRIFVEQLGDVDNPDGFPSKYEVVATFINQSSSTWDVARNMLQLEQHK